MKYLKYFLFSILFAFTSTCASQTIPYEFKHDTLKYDTYYFVEKIKIKNKRGNYIPVDKLKPKEVNFKIYIGETIFIINDSLIYEIETSFLNRKTKELVLVINREENGIQFKDFFAIDEENNVGYYYFNGEIETILVLKPKEETQIEYTK